MPGLHDAEDVAFFHDQQVFTVDLDFGAGPFAKQHFVAGFYGHLDQLTAVFACTFTNADDFAFCWLFFCVLRNDETACCLFVAFNATDQYTVVKWFKCHFRTSPVRVSPMLALTSSE